MVFGGGARHHETSGRDEDSIGGLVLQAVGHMTLADTNCHTTGHDIRWHCQMAAVTFSTYYCQCRYLICALSRSCLLYLHSPLPCSLALSIYSLSLLSLSSPSHSLPPSPPLCLLSVCLSLCSVSLLCFVISPSLPSFPHSLLPSFPPSLPPSPPPSLLPLPPLPLSPSLPPSLPPPQSRDIFLACLHDIHTPQQHQS